MGVTAHRALRSGRERKTAVPVSASVAPLSTEEVRLEGSAGLGEDSGGLARSIRLARCVTLRGGLNSKRLWVRRQVSGSEDGVTGRWQWGERSGGTGHERDVNGTGTGTGTGRERDGNGTGTGQERDMNGTGTGRETGRERDGNGTGTGRERDGNGTERTAGRRWL